MRVAVVNATRRKVGGVEDYLSKLLPALVERGVEVALYTETDRPQSRDPIPLPPGTPVWCESALGRERALAELSGWRPDLVYVHGLFDPELERTLLGIAPGVFFPHAYQGTCISGTKTHRLPVTRPCTARFGWGCIAKYYPRRCGGISPVTMWREFRLQASRLEALREYPAVVTHSTHMRDEYLAHGVEAGRLFQLPYYVVDDDPGLPPRRPPGDEWRLLFIGRMDPLKGGEMLLDSLPRVVQALDRPVRLTFAGDGPDRARWEARAAELERSHPRLRIEFAGWVSPARRGEILSETDLLVVPSLWPEPFGRVGAEAGGYGVPAAAFDVGGIPDWLGDGVSGHLAPGDPPTAVGLADAIARCLADPEEHARLASAARLLSRRFSKSAHVSALLEVFETVLEGGASGRAAEGSEPRPVAGAAHR